MSSTKAENRYRALIERIFKEHYNEGITEFTFEREEIEQAAAKLQFKLPKNLGDLIYSFRYLAALPESIVKLAPEGKTWLIKPAGRGRYQFALSGITPTIGPNKLLAQTKIPDATPGIIARYALSDEQALLAKLRYNRLVDIFTGVASYSLQSHLRTQVARVGQVETDEVYVGLDKRGVQYVFPVQAKGGKDKLNIVQIDQDFAMCAEKFPNLVCRPIAAQFMGDDLIAMFEFSRDDGGTAISSEKHYRLVPPDQVWPEDLTRYQKGPQD